MRTVARNRVIDLPQRGTDIGLERCLCHSLRLKIELVEEPVSIERSPVVDRRLGPSLEERDAQPRRRCDTLRMQRRDDKAARYENWKWVESERGNGLFDLSADIGERNDLSASRPEVLKKMKSRWAAWRKQMDEAEVRGPFRNY